MHPLPASRLLPRLSVIVMMGCGGDHVDPSGPAFFTALDDRPCSSTAGSVDIIMQPRGVAPNAGSDFIDSTSAIDRPPRTLLWVIGLSTLYPSSYGDLTFVLLRVPNPPPVGVYPITPVGDSTVFLEGYTAPWAARGVPFDMSDGGFVTAPFNGTITIEESDATGVVGRFTLDEGRYLFAGVPRCMTASGEFTTRLTGN